VLLKRHLKALRKAFERLLEGPYKAFERPLKGL
jgi:hypothetical protein